ncbi:response regulator transcription factor [Lysobacter sp. A3-1-A15]|uniref:response regulator transcription factor n=1 Tax=Novilysobacter viscosus TaxID=3098602 RepID=UPI002ED92843
MPLSPAAVRVLLVEDDLDVAAGLGAYLEQHGVVVDFAYTAREARRLALDATFDVVVLDVQLPDGDGVALCRALKDQGLRSPVLFLTARGALDDKLRGFEAGGVDYMVKPFAPAELLARIRALAHHIPASGGMLVRAGDFSLDANAALLTGPGGRLVLHATAVLILRRLMDASPGSVTRDELNALLWGDSPPASDPLRMHIYELRQALGRAFGAPLVETVRGVGYRFGAADAGT